MAYSISQVKKMVCAPLNQQLIEELEDIEKKSGLKSGEPTGLKFIKITLDKNNIPFCTELQFAKPRRFKFDVAIPVLKIAIEYEGLVATGKKGGHQTKAGYTSNCDKYNLAADMGWKLYRYTYRNYKDFENDIKTMI